VCGRRAHQDVIEQKVRQTDVRRRKQREFRTGIIKQIHEKQEDRINERRAKYQEGVKIEEQAKERRQKLELAKLSKLNDLRSVLRGGYSYTIQLRFGGRLVTVVKYGSQRQSGQAIKLYQITPYRYVNDFQTLNDAAVPGSLQTPRRMSFTFRF